MIPGACVDAPVATRARLAGALLVMIAIVALAPVSLAEPRATKARPCETSPAGMACIPGGPFTRGRDDGPADERPEARVWLSTFYMDTHEVTVADYEACVARGECEAARTLYLDFSRARQPKVGVSWYDADTYCRAQGKHLPTEAEWEKAARGTDGRRYPWGSSHATCARAVIMDDQGRRACGVTKIGQHPHKGRTAEVGSRPASPRGLHDMAGNAQEWVADWYDKSYATCGAACEGRDPRGPCQGREPCEGHHRRVVRGGSWYWPAEHATTTHRRAHVPSNQPYHHFGFRCAASPDEAALIHARGRRR